MIERKLEHHKNSQCHITIENDGTINFISYTTLVIKAIPVYGSHREQYMLYCNGTYSKTTRKQIGWFLKEYFGDTTYYDMKRCAENGTCVIAKRKHAEFW